MKRIRPLPDSPSGLDIYLSEDIGEAKNWDEFRSHDTGKSYQEVIDSLVDLQHGLCGYCEIDLKETDRQVEHVVPQSAPQQGVMNALDYTNVIACCKGGTLQTDERLRRRRDPVKYNLSCGQAKGDKVSKDFIDPRNLPSQPTLMYVNFEGQMEVDVDSCKICGIDYRKVEKTIEILGLNNERLRQARESRWTALTDIWKSDFQDLKLVEAGAKVELLPNECNHLPQFFTTSRSFFGTYAEIVLSQPPQNWV